MEWAKLHARPKWNLAGSNLLACTLDDLPGAREALVLNGDNDTGYRPLLEAIAARYGVTPDMVATAQGTSGANFLAFIAFLKVGDEVLVERPGYDPLMGPAQLVGATVTRFDRRFEDGYRLDPDAVRRAITPRTRLIVITNAHNPTSVAARDEDVDEIGRIAEKAGAKVLVDEVYLDAMPGGPHKPAGSRSPVFITTSSLTKCYGLAGLRCGWAIGAPDVVERINRARDIVDGTGPIPSERLAVLAFEQLDAFAARARRILDPNRALVAQFLRNHPQLEAVMPGGGTVVFPRLRGVSDAEPFLELLTRTFDTGLVPGRFFQAPAHFRLGFGGTPDVLAEGLNRIGQALETL